MLFFISVQIFRTQVSMPLLRCILAVGSTDGLFIQYDSHNIQWPKLPGNRGAEKIWCIGFRGFY